MARPKNPPRLKSYQNQLSPEDTAKLLDIFSKVGEVASVFELAKCLDINPRFHHAVNGLYRSIEGLDARAKATDETRAEFYAQLNPDDGTSEHPLVIDESEIIAMTEGAHAPLSITKRPDRRLGIKRATYLNDKPLSDVQRETILAALELVGMKTATALARYVDADEDLVRRFLDTEPAQLAATKATPETKRLFKGLVSESHTMTKTLYPKLAQ